MDYTNVDYTNMDITILKAVILIKVGQIFFLLACIHLVYTCMLEVILHSIYQQTNRSMHEHEQDIKNYKTKCESYPFQVCHISHSGQGMYFTTRKPQKGHKHEALASHSTLQRRTHCSYT